MATIGDPLPGSWIISLTWPWMTPSCSLADIGGYWTGATLLWVDALKVELPLPRLWTRIRLPNVTSSFGTFRFYRWVSFLNTLNWQCTGIFIFNQLLSIVFLSVVLSSMFWMVSYHIFVSIAPLIEKIPSWSTAHNPWLESLDEFLEVVSFPEKL